MFYRFIGDRRKAIDLENFYSGSSCFLVGGSPNLDCDNQFELLQQQGIVTMAMNNVATKFKPTFWIGADKPANYSKSILYDNSYLHFAYLSRCGELIDGIRWQDFKNVLFLGSRPDIKAPSFFKPIRYFVWWHNIFLVALQVLYHLGFEKVYTVGCSFKIDYERQYSYKSRLKKEQIEYNQKTYDMVIKQLNEVMKFSNGVNFELISCTRKSKLNEICDYEKFGDILEEMKRKIPEHNTIDIKHPLNQSKNNNQNTGMQQKKQISSLPEEWKDMKVENIIKTETYQKMIIENETTFSSMKRKISDHSIILDHDNINVKDLL